jgi:hypothetical protein
MAAPLQLFSADVPDLSPFDPKLHAAAVVENAQGYGELNLSAAVPPGVAGAIETAQLRVRGNTEGNTGAAKDGAFARPGAFASRYGNLANPIAYGVDYNVDLSNTACATKTATPRETATAHSTLRALRAVRERLGAFGVDVNGPNSGGSMPYRTIEDPVPAPPARHMLFTEKNVASGDGPGTFSGAHVAGQQLLKSAADAYQTYGYREEAAWERPGARENAERASAEHTRVTDFDTSLCAPGQEIVNGQCFSSGHSQVTCPPGFALADNGECMRTPTLQPM